MVIIRGNFTRGKPSRKRPSNVFLRLKISEQITIKVV